MELLLKEDQITLNIGTQTLWGTYNKCEEDHFGCKFVFEPPEDKFLLNKITNYCGENFARDVCITAGYKSKNYQGFLLATIGRVRRRLHFSVLFHYTQRDWDEKLNLKHFLAKIISELEKIQTYEVSPILDFDDDSHIINLNFSTRLDIPLGTSMEAACEYMASAHQAALDNFSEEDGFISQFRFPQEYKSAFIQYLTYFGKFLEDLGIQGNLTLREKDGLTYLTFQAENKNVALENIAIALNAYLSLPDNNNSLSINHNSSLESEIRFQQLSAVVDHLKSQLKLSNAILSIKQREIAILENQISARTKAVSENIKDYWEPIKGLRITPYKGKFFEINIPKLLKGITRKLNQK